MKRAAVVVFGLIVAIPVVAVLASGALLDSGPVRTRLVAALARGTGHAVRIDGPVRVSWSPAPVIEARDVVLLNGPGFSAPVFATVGRVQAQVALLPLLSGRVEVAVTLARPEVMLERDAAGRGNWQAPAAVAGAAPSTPGAPRLTLDLQGITIEDGRVALPHGPALAVRALSLKPGGGPVQAELLLNGVPMVVSGTIGPVGHGPVRIDLTATGGGLALAASGLVGGAVAVQARVPDLAAVSPLAGRSLPPLRDVQVTGALGAAGPEALRLTAAASALDTVLPGLRLEQLVVEATALDQPVRLSAVATLHDLPVAAAVNVASLGALLAGGALPFQVKLVGDGASVSGQGSVADLVGHGLEMTVSVQAPDVRRTGALAGQRWPGLRDVVLEARVLPRAGMPEVLVRGLRLTSAQGDLAGDLALGWAPRPSVRGSLVSQRLDLDAIVAAGSAPAPATPAPTAVPPPVAGPAAAAAPVPLPFQALRAADVDLRLAVAQAVLHGAAYRAIEAHLVLADGRLRLDPVQTLAPGGPVEGQLLADAGAVPPTASFTLRAPALDAAPLAAALGAPGAASGTMELNVQLGGAGADLRAMAATLTGHVAAAMVEGEIDNQALATLFGPALQAARLPAEAAGRSHVRCLALKADAAAGQVTVQTLALDATRLRLEGEGTVNLVDDTMNMHLRPTIRIGPTAVAVPVHLTGPLRAPVPAVERGASAGSAPGRFGISIGGSSAADPCPAGLAAVRAR